MEELDKAKEEIDGTRVLKSWSRKGKRCEESQLGDTQTPLDNSTSGSISGRFSPRLSIRRRYRRGWISPDGDLG